MIRFGTVDKADKLTIELVPAATDDVRSLIRALDQELAQEYTSEQRHGLTLDAIFQSHVRFFLARLDEEPVGCGGVAFFADFAEVKRMFVRSTVRGRGVARELLTRIETEARHAGLTVLRLETGSRQAAALRLYERAGFQICEAFGVYKTMAPEAIATSVFMEKRLSTPPPDAR